MARRMKPQSFNTWLKPTRGEPTDNGDFKIAVHNQFVADWIDSHFRDLIDEALIEVVGEKMHVIYVLSGISDCEEQTSINFSALEIESQTGYPAGKKPQPQHSLLF